jgi:integrase
MPIDIASNISCSVTLLTLSFRIKSGTGVGQFPQGIKRRSSMSQWKHAGYTGIRYREHSTRKHGIKPDRYFAIRYRIDGKLKEEALGWATEGWTVQKAILELTKLKQSNKLAEGPRTLKEKRDKAKAQHDTEEQNKAREEQESTTFGQYFEQVYYPIAQTHKKEQTYIKEELHNRLWIDPVLGKKELKMIKPFDLERLKKKLLDDHKSPRTVQYVFATFRQVWNMARRDGLITDDSPTKQVKTPKFDNKRQRFMTPDEEQALLNKLMTMNPIAGNMTLLSLRTGMRASEIFNLKWAHIDTENGRILIMDAKGDKSRIAFMTEDIKALFNEMEQKEPNDYVFTSIKGEKYREMPETFRTVVDKLKLNEGITDTRQHVCFHTCRHTFASRLAGSGVDLYTIKTLLGHSTIALTERYSHLTEGTLQNAIRTLDQSITQIKHDNVVSLNKK